AGPATAGFVVSRFEKLRPSLSLVPHRLAILRSFTVEPVVPLLRAAAFLAGIDLTVHVGDFNTYAQEILDANSTLYQFGPDTVLLAVQTRDVARDLWAGFAALELAAARAAGDRVAAGFETWLNAFRANSPANLVIHTLEAPATVSHGLLDQQLADGQAEIIQDVNCSIRRAAGKLRGVYVLDYDALIARHGRLRWHDERKWLMMRMPLSAEGLSALAVEWLRVLHPLAGRVCKVLVTDLDNTLWGGVVGEDGPTGVRVGPEVTGAPYLAVQQVLLDLYHRGIILAVCSKNNEADALEVFKTHPGMIVKAEHFVAKRINWHDKAQNLREIAAELNVGLDSLAFLDDNPAERERVRGALPEVTVLDLPADSFGFATVVRECPLFERLVVSAEDRERGRHYAAQQQRTALREHAGSLEDYYRSLEQVVRVAPASASSVARVAQLTQKTNQFNLTTRRYGEAQIAERCADPEWDVHCVSVKDRFGDNGLVGVVMARAAGNVYEVDTFLLSCRVIGRTVETATLSVVAGRARDRGFTEVRGWFLPSKKNAPCKDVYPNHGFRAVAERDGGTLWARDLTADGPRCPEWINLVREEPVYA
ncbi:MAG TPA: HAD-IIIC family phosphatase, partial [Gemmataceae bacterium]|nr:HAD-IIIC family phosphatase [Gemmataceae bacterium]